MPGRIQLLGTTELYEYYVLVYVQKDGYCQTGYICTVQRNIYINRMYWCMYRRMDIPGRIQLLGITELYEYYVLVYVQEDGYTKKDTAALFNGTVLILCTSLCTGGWICQDGYICSVQRNYSSTYSQLHILS